MNELHLRLFISVRCRRRRPLDLLSTNWFGVVLVQRSITN